jgi:hypothetical protein
MERAFTVDAALDAALLAARAPNQQAALAALGPQLGESRAAVLEGSGPIEERIQRERVAMRARFITEERATETRLRWLIVVVTTMAAVFVIAMVGGLSRRPPGGVELPGAP